MQKRQESSYNFYFFFIVALIIFILSYFGYLNFLKFPFEKAAGIFAKGEQQNLSKESKFEKENKELLKIAAEKKSLEEEIKALKDQFQTTYPKSLNLLPAKIVGAPKLYPGQSEPREFIIDKGQRDGVKTGMAVVSMGNLVGKISKTSSFLSRIDLITNNNFSSTAKSASSALGVVKTKENQMILENVLLSESLKNNDMVFTKGDLDLNGVGISPDLIIGKIISVEKNPSSLFQTASLKSFVNFSKLSTVFIVVSQ